MKIKHLFWLCFFVFATLGCSKSDDEPPEEPAISVPNFRVIGEDTDNIYQYNHKIAPEQAEIVNLTTENKVDREYLTLRQVDELVTFYSFSGGQFSAVQRNVITGENNAFFEFYESTLDKSITWGTNSKEEAFFGFFSGTTRNFGILSVDFASGEEKEAIIALDVNRVFEPIFNENRLIITIKGVNGDFSVIVFDTLEQEVQQTFNFSNLTPSVFIDDNKDML